MIFRGKQAVLDRKLAHRNLQNLEVSNFFHHRRRFMRVATVAMFVCCLHVSPACLIRIPVSFKRTRASGPETRSATYRSRTDTPPKGPSDGTGRCNIVRAGHPG